jgi:hypothetical protein
VTDTPLCYRCRKGQGKNRNTFGFHSILPGAGISVEELLNNYLYLEREDIMQALQYTAEFDDCYPLQ